MADKGALGPCAAAGEPCQGVVGGEGPVEILLVAPQCHEVRSASQKLDHLGAEFPFQVFLPGPECVLAGPRHEGHDAQRSRQADAQYQTGHRRQGGHHVDGGQRCGDGDDHRCDAAQIEVLQEVDVAGGTGQQITAAPGGQPGRRPRFEFVVQPHPDATDGVEGGVMGNEALAVPQRPAAESQQLHGRH
jgi:hypothetical protein